MVGVQLCNPLFIFADRCHEVRRMIFLTENTFSTTLPARYDSTSRCNVSMPSGILVINGVRVGTWPPVVGLLLVVSSYISTM